MSEVDTLFVISSSRGEYALDDLLNAIAFHNPQESQTHTTIAIDETGQIEHLDSQGHFYLTNADPADESASGFKRAQGVAWAISQGIQFKQAILLDDSCLIYGGSLSQFCLQHSQKPGVGAIGVGHAVSGEAKWQAVTNLFYEYALPHEFFQHAPLMFADAFLVYSRPFVDALTNRGLLVPPHAERWTAGYGAYAAWVSLMLGFYSVAWGYTHKVLPPFCVLPTNQFAPAPHILSDRFMLFSPLTAIPGYSESDIREMYKRQRGEAAREVAPFGPTVIDPVKG